MLGHDRIIHVLNGRSVGQQNDPIFTCFMSSTKQDFNKRRTSPIKGFSDCSTYDDIIILVRYTVGRPLRVGRAQEVDALRSFNLTTAFSLREIGG
jgi:hypothetical protein